MADEQKTKPRLEIGHVLFLDVVGYSKLRISQQSQLLRELNRVVSGTNEFRQADNEGKLVRLPTGDGMALVFQTTPEAPVQCALEISQALKAHPNIQLRMGIHSGPVNEVIDVNQRANIAGAGINLAQRIMDCGDAGHILVSKHVAEDLEQYDDWQPCLHDLGECEVKHGVRVHVFNLYTDELGNSETPAKFKSALAAKRTSRRTLLRLSAISGVLVAAFLVWWFLKNSNAPHTAATSDKSVAVVPFVNMSADKNDEYLSDGMTEELINVLAKVPGLRVPGRTSCFAFKNKNDEDIFRKVGDQLHVAAVLEGSVRKASDKLRVTAQLINVADGYHLWSKHYDGDVKDILNFQSKVAEQVVQALQVQLGTDETRALTKKPTENPEAHRLYLLGRYHVDKFTETDIAVGVHYFERALQLDPGFALAYCGLADAYAAQSGNVMPAREASAKTKTSAQKALALDPELAEAHVSLARALRGAFEWPSAEKELTRALELNPNLALAYDEYALLLTFLGRFDEAIANERKALQLDPLNPSLNGNLGWFFYWAVDTMKRFGSSITPSNCFRMTPFLISCWAGA